MSSLPNTVISNAEADDTTLNINISTDIHRMNHQSAGTLSCSPTASNHSNSPILFTEYTNPSEHHSILHPHLQPPPSSRTHDILSGSCTSSSSNMDDTNEALNHSQCIQSGMERASLLVTGWIRREQLHCECVNLHHSPNSCMTKEIVCGHHTHFPLPILSLITMFYPKMNGTLFCWHIDNPNIIKNFVNAKHKQRFASDIFEMKNLKWYLSAYPNGDRKEGSCTVYLTLISFPPIWSKFVCNYSIYCNQTRSSATYITTLSYMVLSAP